MKTNEAQQSIRLIVNNKRLSKEASSILKTAVMARLETIRGKKVTDKLNESLVEQSTQSRENESAIARKTHYHLKSIDSSIRELIDTIKEK